MNQEKVAAYYFIDVKNSREIFENQEQTYELLSHLRNYLNTQYSSQLSTPFAIREGDAIVGGAFDLTLVLALYQTCIDFTLTKAYQQWLAEQQKLDQPIRFYFGVGIGNITTPTEALANIETVNGTALSYAKKAVELAKDAANNKHDYQYTTQLFQFYAKSSDDCPLDKVLNPMMYLIYEQLIRNEKQNQLFSLKTKYPGLKNYELAQKLGYKFDKNDPLGRQKASTKISNLLGTSKYATMEKARLNLQDVLANYTVGGEC